MFARPFHVKKYIFHPNTFNGIRDTILVSRIPFGKVDFKILCGIYFILMLSRFLIVLLEDGPERLLGELGFEDCRALDSQKKTFGIGMCLTEIRNICENAWNIYEDARNIYENAKNICENARRT